MKQSWAEKLGLTESEYKELCSAIRRTWNYIASDVLPLDGMPPDEVIEVTLDANRVTHHNRHLSEKIKKLLDSYDSEWYDILENALKAEVFTASEY